MLPRPLRVTKPAEHRLVVRTGRRGAAPTLTVHLLEKTARSPERSDRSPAGPGLPLRAAAGPARAGLVVGKTVGNSVQRHRVSRRLRHLLADRLRKLPAGTLVVVRARPGAAAATTDLSADLDTAFRRIARGPADRRSRSDRRSEPPSVRRVDRGSAS